MAQPTIFSQSSSEQLAEWGPKFESGRWLGCYAQTELAHGSNLSRLQTTATLDLATDEWVIHTPKPEDGKFWIGTAGKTATHALVQADLQIPLDGRLQKYGMHPILVPLRSLENHHVLPGRTILDIGPKLGSNTMDNGYLRFDQVRVPRTNLLMRYVQVTRDGRYQKRNENAALLSRGTMSLVRVFLVELACLNLARGLTIAVRYAMVRRQGSSSTKTVLEPQIMDYQSVQLRVVPLIAQTYVLTFAAQWMRQLHSRLMAELQEQNTRLLNVVHAYSSGLKAHVTQVAYDGIDRARQALGGLGYLSVSGFDGFSQDTSCGWDDCRR